VARLSASGGAPEEDHDTAARMRLVDHLMKSAPLVMPGMGFAERVIEAIRRQEIDPFNRDSAFGVILGLGVAAAVVVSALSAFALVVANVVINWTRVYQWAVMGGGAVASTFTEAYDKTGSLLSDSPLIGVLMLLSVPLFCVWVGLMLFLKPTEMGA
jgi:hypothetical protein